APPLLRLTPLPYTTLFRSTNVVNTGGGLAVFLSPNPLNPVATLTFTTSKAGRVSVSIFDLQGRLVRTLEPGAYLEAGYHDFQVRSEEHTSELQSRVELVCR